MHLDMHTLWVCNDKHHTPAQHIHARLLDMVTFSTYRQRRLLFVRWLAIHDATVKAVKVRHSSYRQCDDHAGSTRALT